MLTQSGILVNMITSFCLLGHRFNALHIGGAMVVYIGVGLDLFPMFMNHHVESSNALLWVWIVILFFSAVPTSISNVIKEFVLKDLDMDIWYIQSWCMLFQLLVTLFCNSYL